MRLIRDVTKLEEVMSPKTIIIHACPISLRTEWSETRQKVGRGDEPKIHLVSSMLFADLFYVRPFRRSPGGSQTSNLRSSVSHTRL
jgi:hypothetical protein